MIARVTTLLIAVLYLVGMTNTAAVWVAHGLYHVLSSEHRTDDLHHRLIEDVAHNNTAPHDDTTGHHHHSHDTPGPASHFHTHGSAEDDHAHAQLIDLLLARCVNDTDVLLTSGLDIHLGMTGALVWSAPDERRCPDPLPQGVPTTNLQPDTPPPRA